MDWLFSGSWFLGWSRRGIRFLGRRGVHVDVPILAHLVFTEVIAILTSDLREAVTFSVLGVHPALLRNIAFLQWLVPSNVLLPFLGEGVPRSILFHIHVRAAAVLGRF